MCFTWKESENAGRFREIARYHHFGKSEKVFVSFRFVLCYTHEIEGKEGETPLFGTKKWKNNIHIANLSLKLSGPYVYTKAYISIYTKLFYGFVFLFLLQRGLSSVMSLADGRFYFPHSPHFFTFFFVNKIVFWLGVMQMKEALSISILNPSLSTFVEHQRS